MEDRNIKSGASLNIMIRSELQNKYQEFFKKFLIDDKTGILRGKPRLKFPVLPYIGYKYGDSKRILIVGLDVGADEKVGGIQSFDERQKAIEYKKVSKHNPHIAGTYFTALFFLKDTLNWQSHWNRLKNASSCQKALRNDELLPKSNPLSYVALTNFYKFVSVKRRNRSGGENRKYINKQYELNFFIDEVKIFDPDIIVFQSSAFRHQKTLLNQLVRMGKLFYIGPHPAYRGKRSPIHFLKQIISIESRIPKMCRYYTVKDRKKVLSVLQTLHKKGALIVYTNNNSEFGGIFEVDYPERFKKCPFFNFPDSKRSIGYAKLNNTTLELAYREKVWKGWSIRAVEKALSNCVKFERKELIDELD